MASDVDATEASGLLRITAEGVEFRHPLVRSAVYQSAAFSERALVHAALARTADPDRRAWHLAAALAGPDDTIADALAESARRASRRGGYGAAASAWQRASSLTADPRLRAGRLAAAAEAAWLAGHPASAGSLLRQTRGLPADAAALANIEYLQALIEIADATPADACLRLTAAADAITADHPALAQKLLLQAREAAVLCGRHGRRGTHLPQGRSHITATSRATGSPPSSSVASPTGSSATTRARSGGCGVRWRTPSNPAILGACFGPAWPHLYWAMMSTPAGSSARKPTGRAPTAP